MLNVKHPVLHNKSSLLEPQIGFGVKPLLQPFPHS